MNKHAEDTNEYANALLRAAKGEQKVSETYKAVAALEAARRGCEWGWDALDLWATGVL